jgi:hypothetical protein
LVPLKNPLKSDSILAVSVRICVDAVRFQIIFMEFSKQEKGVTSVKVSNAPGGKSNFSLAWDEPAKPANQYQSHLKKPQQEITGKPNQLPAKQVVPVQQPVPAGKTSVKVVNPPGGKSSITFG